MVIPSFDKLSSQQRLLLSNAQAAIAMDLRQVHRVFKDETRSRLVELLAEKGHLSYTDIQRLLAIKNTGKLNYHIRVLEDLIQKDPQTGMYSLSEKGKVAAQFATKFDVANHGPPTGVVLIGVLMIIGGFGTAVGSAPSLASCFVGGGACQGAVVVDLLSTFLVLVIYGFASAGNGVGLLTGRRWARRAAIYVSIAMVFVYAGEIIAVTMLTGGSSLQMSDLVETIPLLAVAVPIPAIIIYYLTRPRIKNYFGLEGAGLGGAAAAERGSL